MANNRKNHNIPSEEENPLFHDTWKLLKNYRDAVWNLELAVQQVRNSFEIEFGSSIEEFLDSIYLAGADIGGTKLENYAKSIERSNKMLNLLNSAVDILRSKHKHGEQYYGFFTTATSPLSSSRIRMRLLKSWNLILQIFQKEHIIGEDQRPYKH